MFIFARRVGAVLLFVVGLLICLIAIILGPAMEGTIARSVVFDRQFRETAAAIDIFQQSHHRLPSNDELKNLSAIPNLDLEVMPSGFSSCGETPEDYSRLPSRDYILAFWRGEWYECYVPSRGMSTLQLSASTVSGNEILDQLAFALLAIFCFLASIWLWRSGRRVPLQA
jgi:hypothetical protein